MKKSFSFFLLVFIASNYSFAQQDYLIPFREGDKWGYCDTFSRIVIPVQYDDARRFFGGYARVKKDAQNGIIDRTGKVVLMGDFYIETPWGKTTSITKGDKTGLADVSTGQILLEPIYSGMYENDVLAAVRDEKGRYGLFHIGLRRWILPIKYQEIDLRDNYLIVQSGQKKSYYVVSATGKLINKSAPTKPTPAKKESRPNKNRNAKQIIPDEEVLMASEVSPFSYQYGTFKSEGKVGYYVKTINTESNKVIKIDSIPALFESIKELDISLSLLIAKKDGKTGMIDIRGNLKIPFLYDEIVRTVNSGMDSIYVVKKDGKWGLTQYEKILLPCEYDEVVRYYDLNKDGFYLKQGVKRGFYVYSDERKVYNLLIPCKYENVADQLYWIVQADMNVNMPHDVTPKAPFYILLVRTNGWKSGYVDMKGNEFFRE